MSKGSAVRPRVVSSEEWERRWTETFGGGTTTVKQPAPIRYYDGAGRITGGFVPHALPQPDGHP